MPENCKMSFKNSFLDVTRESGKFELCANDNPTGKKQQCTRHKSSSMTEVYIGDAAAYPRSNHGVVQALFACHTVGYHQPYLNRAMDGIWNWWERLPEHFIESRSIQVSTRILYVASVKFMSLLHAFIPSIVIPIITAYRLSDSRKYTEANCLSVQTLLALQGGDGGPGLSTNSVFGPLTSVEKLTSRINRHRSVASSNQTCGSGKSSTKTRHSDRSLKETEFTTNGKCNFLPQSTRLFISTTPCLIVRLLGLFMRIIFCFVFWFVLFPVFAVGISLRTLFRCCKWIVWSGGRLILGQPCNSPIFVEPSIPSAKTGPLLDHKCVARSPIVQSRLGRTSLNYTVVQELAGLDVFLFSDPYMMITAIAWMNPVTAAHLRPVLGTRLMLPEYIDSTTGKRFKGYPRLYSKVRKVAGMYCWVTDDDPLDMEYHVVSYAKPVVSVRPNFCGAKECDTFKDKPPVNAAISEISSQPLDPTRPLWQITVIEDLETRGETEACIGGEQPPPSNDANISNSLQKGSVVVLKVHHAVGDGVSLIDFFIKRILDPSPEREAPGSKLLVSSGSTGFKSLQHLADLKTIPMECRTSTKIHDKRDSRCAVSPVSTIDVTPRVFPDKSPVNESSRASLFCATTDLTNCQDLSAPGVPAYRRMEQLFRSALKSHAGKWVKGLRCNGLVWAKKTASGVSHALTVAQTPLYLWRLISMRKERAWDAGNRLRPCLSFKQQISMPLAIPLDEIRIIRSTLQAVSMQEDDRENPLLRKVSEYVGPKMRFLGPKQTACKYTVNDVLVACLVGGYHRYMELMNNTSDDEPTPCHSHLNLILPVNVRSLKPFIDRSSSKNLFNAFATCIVAVPTCKDSPLAIKRLEFSTQTLSHFKNSNRTISQVFFETLMQAFLPDFIYWVFSLQAKSVSGIFSNVVGPQKLGTFGSRRVRDISFVVPRPMDVGVGVSALSYENRIYITVSSDEACLRNPNLFRECISETVAQLTTECRQLRKILNIDLHEQVPGFAEPTPKARPYKPLSMTNNHIETKESFVVSPVM